MIDLPMDSFFTTADGGWFEPTDHTRGPWSTDACHAGPPTGLLARAVEQLVPDLRLVRLNVDLTRPVPFAGFRLDAQIKRSGRTVTTTTVELHDRDGKVCATGRGLHVAAQPEMDFPTAAASRISPDDAPPGQFPITRTLHDLPSFAGPGVQIRYPQGESPLPGPTTAWMRTVPLLPGEVPSGFQRICPLADCGNAFARNAEPWEVSFVNADLTILLHRVPQGDWLGSSSVSYWEPDGIGFADAALFDAQGPVGRAMQTLVLRKLSKS